MEISVNGLLLLKQAEGFKSRVYKDVAGLPTIGYGHKLRPDESFSDGVTQDQASLILQGDLREVEAQVAKLVTVPLTQGQFDALVDFTYNLGAGRLQHSTLLSLLNQGHYESAANGLLKWDHSGSVEVEGLKVRREAEYKLWHS